MARADETERSPVASARQVLPAGNSPRDNSVRDFKEIGRTTWSMEILVTAHTTPVNLVHGRIVEPTSGFVDRSRPTRTRLASFTASLRLEGGMLSANG